MNVIVRGLATNYLDEGKGTVVVLLHGWGQNLRTFDGLAQELSGKHRVVRLDLPGFGGSQRPQTPWGVGEYAGFLREFLAKVRATQVAVLIGHSFGGRIVIKALGNQLITVDAAVLLDAAGVRHSGSARNQLWRLAAKTGKAVTGLPGLRGRQAGLRAKLYQAAGSSDYVTAGPMQEIFVRTIAEDLQADAAKIAALSLLIWGADDAETPVADGRLLHAAISGSRLEIVADAGHFSYLDRPHEVARLIKDFIA